MPISPPDSSDSPTPSAMPSGDPAAGATGQNDAAPPLEWRTNALLFVATAASCFYTFRREVSSSSVEAAQYTAALLAILLVHEFGHYIAARLHKVDASLPFFL